METIKEEKKADLEQLLNSLIDMGWKPYGIDKDDIEVCSYEKNRKKISIGYMNWSSPSEGDYDWLFMSLRELVSKESGLWQFVCENKMEKKMEKNHRGIWINSWAKSAYQSYPLYTMERYEYRVIESSLKDDSELEDFLLSNIKVNE